MGHPIDPCFKQNNVYKLFNNNTTTTSTSNPNIDSDFFILPTSGVICPSIELNLINNTWDYPEIPIIEKNTFVCVSELYETNPCIIELDKYIKIADINIETNRCKRYKLIVKDLQIPTITTTTTTTTTTSTTTTVNPSTTTTITTSTTTTNSPSCFSMRYGLGVSNIQNYGSYAIGTVTALLSGPIWGTNSYGYTDDSRFNTAVIHAGLLSAGQTGQIKFTYLGIKNNFPSSTSNGITSSSWIGNWCAVSLSLP